MNFLKSLNLRTTILLLIPGSLWGFAYILNEIIIETIPPFTRGVTRSFVMIVPLVIILTARGGKLKSTWEGWRPYIFVGLFDNAIPGVLIAWGQLYIDGGLTTILLALSPLFTVFLAHYFSYNDKLNAQKIFGIALGLLGTLILVGPSALLNVGANLWGQLAVIGGALCFSMTAIYIRVHFQKKSGSPLDSALETLTHQLFIATLVLIPFMWVIDQPWTLQPSLASVAALFAWGTSIIALLLYYSSRSAVRPSSIPSEPLSPRPPSASRDTHQRRLLGSTSAFRTRHMVHDYGARADFVWRRLGQQSRRQEG